MKTVSHSLQCGLAAELKMKNCVQGPVVAGGCACIPNLWPQIFINAELRLPSDILCPSRMSSSAKPKPLKLKLEELKGDCTLTTAEDAPSLSLHARDEKILNPSLT